MRQDAATAVIPVALEAPEGQPSSPPDTRPTTEIGNRIESAGGLVIAGDRLHGALLRQFYAAHHFEPVWPNRQAQAESLLKAVMRAGEHGLDPELFHAALLRNLAGLSPLDRELLLSDAFLAYADALARGVLPIERRMDDEDLAPEPVDVPAALDRAIDSADPAAAIEALAPDTPAYRALRQALKAARSGSTEPATGPQAGGPRHAAADRSGASRVREIEVNLERQRWLPRHISANRVWVNLADARLTLYRDDRPVFTTRVVVGEADKQSPELQTTVNGILFNPPWNVPRSIVSNEIGPKLAHDPGYLSRHHMVWHGNGLLQQLPPSALGQLKLEMPNRFDVYLHDTPDKHLFALDNRRRSHGCIRVENPRELAALLLQQPGDAVSKAIGLGRTNLRPLPTPLPVFLVYQTAFVDSDGRVQFRPDVYNRDVEIWEHLHPTRQAPVAQHETGSQRRG